MHNLQGQFASHRPPHPTTKASTMDILDIGVMTDHVRVTLATGHSGLPNQTYYISRDAILQMTDGEFAPCQCPEEWVTALFAAINSRISTNVRNKAFWQIIRTTYGFPVRKLG